MINIVIPVYNSDKWIKLGINILKLQTYIDWKCIIVDDYSTDNTYHTIVEETKDDDRFKVIRNKKNNGSSLANYIKGFDILNPKDQDIIVWVDGDDWLASNFVLEELNVIYENQSTWMTYGTWKSFPQGNITKSRYQNIPSWIYEQNAFRSRKWSYNVSHLRTHKAFLFRAIDRKDMWDNRCNEYYREASDTVYLYPMQEMSGEIHSVRNDNIALILNRSNPLNEAIIKRDQQLATEHIVRNKRKYTLLEK